MREFIQQTLNALIALPNHTDENSYHHAFSRYRRFLENPNGEYRNCALTIKEIWNEKHHTLRPYFKEKINNLKNILDGKYSKVWLSDFQKKQIQQFLVK